MTLCIDILRTFSCIIRVFYSFVLLTVHLCAIVTRFNKCNLLTYLLTNVYSLQSYFGSPSISVENREFYSYIVIVLSLNFEVLCKRDVRSRDRDETETTTLHTTSENVGLKTINH